MIIAHKNGTLISATLVSEDHNKIVLKAHDNKHNTIIKRDDRNKRVFDNVYDAIEWIESFQ